MLIYTFRFIPLNQKVSYAQRNVKEFGLDNSNFKLALVRPFDNMYTYFTNKSKGFIAYPVYEVMRHLIHKDKSKNLGLIIGKSGIAVGDMPWNLCFITNTIVDLNVFYRGGGYVYPLYVDTNTSVNQGKARTQEIGDTGDTIIPNLNEGFVKHITECLGGETPTPENIQDYIYAILYSSAYREKFKEQLKYHFPRIPYPSSSEYFYKMSELGRKLRNLHLMDASEKWNAKNIYPFKGDSSSVVVKPYWKDCRIYINEDNYYDNVSQEIWSYYIGGYQVAEKWLKDRKGTELDFHEIVHYSNILYVIAHTLLTTQAIDEVYKQG